MISFFPIFQWASKLWIAKWVGDSNWIFPAVEAVHIVALALLLGAIIFVDLQLLGVIRQGKSVSRLEMELRPWTLSSLIVILLSGFILFTTEATKLYTSGPFQVKMTALILAIVFHFTVHRLVTRTDERRIGPLWGKLTAVVSLLLWTTVGFAGRGIAFL